MKKILLLLFLSILSLSAFSQDYHLFSYQGNPLYELKNGNNYQNELYSFDLRQKIVNSQGDSIIYHTLLSNQTTTHPTYGCGMVRDSSFFGNATVIQPDFSFIFYNKNGETITIKPHASVGDSWTAYTFEDSSRVEAHLLSIDWRDVYGIMDSVKHIRFLVKDTNNIVVNHPLNTHQMTVSQHFGMIKGLNFLDFPDLSSYLELVGHPALNTNIYQPKWSDIYNFDVGDIFHIQEGRASGPLWEIYYDEWNVLSKNVTGTEYIYTIDKKRATVNYSGDTIYQRDTLTVAYPLTHYSDTTQSFELFASYYTVSPNPNYWATVYNNDYNGRMTKLYHVFDGGIQQDSCLVFTLGIPTPINYYIEGVGGPYFSEATIGHESRLLKYYKKGTETWGTPYDFDLLSSTKQVKLATYPLQIMPNPATHQVRFSIKNEMQNSHLRIFDITGKVVYEELLGNENSIDLSVANWVNGIYWVRIVGEERVWTGKLVKQ